MTDIQQSQQLKNNHYYFQYTLTAYGKDIEPNLPNKNINAIPIKEQKAEEQIYFAKNLSDIAQKHGMQTEFETM